MSDLLPTAPAGLTAADVEAYLDRLRSGWLTMGPITRSLEEAFASLHATEDAVAVSSGTAGLLLALLGLGLSADDEVVVSSLDPSAATLVERAGARPVVCDVDAPHRPWLDVGTVGHLLGPSTRAVVLQHPFGLPAPADRLRALCDAKGVTLIEDVRHALGARLGDGSLAGTTGEIAVFSFGPGRQIQTGEGGMVLAADPDVFAKVKSLRSHAMTTVTWERHTGHALGYDVVDIGFNFRMDEPRAALGLSQLGRLPELVAHRSELADAYADALRDCAGLRVAIPVDGSWSPVGVAVAVDPELRQAIGAALEAPLDAATSEARTAWRSVDGGDAGLVLLPIWSEMRVEDARGIARSLVDALGRV